MTVLFLQLIMWNFLSFTSKISKNFRHNIYLIYLVNKKKSIPLSKERITFSHFN